jgi:hypothetical protein
MKPTIALFVADPYCSVQSGNGVITALGNNYNFKIFGKNILEDNFFDDVDLIVIPGGFGDANRIQEFVKGGGGYLGICMGAYWAGRHYLNILDSVDAVQYITRPNTDTRRPHAKAIDINWQGHPDRMFFYDGCALVGDRSKFETVATYANGDAMSIVQGHIGLIGCHPESEKFWYDSYSWMGQHWHNRKHHRLLLDFVNKLI